jgi:hypothetical protein
LQGIKRAGAKWLDSLRPPDRGRIRSSEPKRENAGSARSQSGTLCCCLRSWAFRPRSSRTSQFLHPFLLPFPAFLGDSDVLGVLCVRRAPMSALLRPSSAPSELGVLCISSQGSAALSAALHPGLGSYASGVAPRRAKKLQSAGICDRKLI